MRSILAVAVIAAVAMPAMAQAQSQGQMVALAERVDRLQRDVDVLQVRLARSGGSTGNAASGVAVAQAGGVTQGFIDTTETRFARLER